MDRKPLQRRFAAALLLAAGAVLSPAQAAFTPPTTLTVVTDDNYPPYLFRTSDGLLQGSLKDKWDLWSQRTGVAVQMQGTEWARAQQQVRRGTSDVLEAVALTPERASLYEFSPPYEEVDARVFFHQSVSGINHVASMRGFTIGAKDGSACGRWLAREGAVMIRPYPTSEALVASALAGEVRLFCMDTPVAQYFLVKMGKDEEWRQTGPLYTTSLHWAVAHGRTELRDFVQAGFALITPAETKAIEARWLGSPVNALLGPRYRDIVITVVVGLLGLGALLLAWNRTLRVRVAAGTAQLREALEHSDRQAAQVRDLYNNAPCGYHSLNADGVYVEINDTELRWLGYARDEVVGRKRFSDFLAEAGREAFRANFAKFVEDGELRDVEYDLLRRDGTTLKVLLSATMIRDAAGRLVMSRATVFDITDRNLAEQRITHLAHHDALTGLPNRALLRDRLEQAIAHAHRDGRRAAVLFLDLDRFKTINDSLGHAVGDRLLQAVASRIQLCVREGDTVARLGGDEFVVVLRDVGSADDGGLVAEKIIEALAESFRIQAHDLHVTTSIGISLYPSDGANADALMRHADTAMYHAKDAGRANFQFFIEGMNVAAQRRLAMETNLRRAIANREFELHYQALFDLRDRSITGFEALLRWMPPGGDPIPPGQFIALAEDSRLIVPIGEWVLQEALVQARRWQSGPRPLKVAVNVSANQLERSNFVDMLRRAVKDAGVDPRLVELEVTEGVIVESSGGAREAIDALDAFGVNIVIDDFGTGYSGLTYLKRLPIDKVKIDQSFVRDLTVDPDDKAIVTAIVAMARSLGVDVVAEGVETEEQLVMLRALGCHRGQGYHLARPVNAAAAATMAGVPSGRVLAKAEELG